MTRVYLSFLCLFFAEMSAIAGEDSAKSQITLTVPPLVRISQLEDIDLGVWSGQGGMDAERTVCVWSSVNEYSLTASSGTAYQGQFSLGAAADKHVRYRVFWNDGSGFQELQHGEQVRALSSSADDRGCAGDESARSTLRVEILQENLGESRPGDYGDVLTLVVGPE